MENITKEIKKSQGKSVRFFDLMNTRTWWLCCTNWTSASSDLDACINWEVQAGRGWVTCEYSRLLSILTAKPLAVRKMVPSEDMCLLAMNILYSSNHKKEKSIFLGPRRRVSPPRFSTETMMENRNYDWACQKQPTNKFVSLCVRKVEKSSSIDRTRISTVT